MLSKFIKQYADNNPEKFNEEFINLKEQDDVLECINDIFRALEVIEGIEFLESELITDESKFPPIMKDDVEIMNIEISRLNMIKFKFKITGNDRKKGKKDEIKTDIVEKFIFYPKTMEGYHFLLNDSRHYPIFQIIDSATYRHVDSLTLKTLLMPIKIRTEEVELYDINDKSYKVDIRVVDLFKRKINYLYYYLAKFGYNKTMEFFGYADKFEILNKIDDLNHEEYLYFPLNKSNYIQVDKDMLEIDEYFVYNYIDCICDNRNYDSIYNQDYWINELGSLFSKNRNNQNQKALDILLSFERILDGRTKRILPLQPDNKESIFHLVRWMTKRYDVLRTRNNMDLENKRLRVVEYLLYNLLRRFSTITYRLLNTNNPTLKDKHQLFSALSPMYVIKKMGSNELLRYMGGVNGVDLFNSKLKFSYRGSQGLGSGKSNVNMSYRGIDPSYMGRIGLTTASASDPGRQYVMPDCYINNMVIL